MAACYCTGACNGNPRNCPNVGVPASVMDELDRLRAEQAVRDREKLRALLDEELDGQG